MMNNVNQKLFKRTTLSVLFIYIVIFSTTTLPVLNRAGLVIVCCCGGLYCLLNASRITARNNSFFNSMFLYGVIVLFAKFYSTAPDLKVNEVFIGYISMLIVISVVTFVVDDENDIKFLLKAFAVSALVQFIYMLSVYGIDIIRVISQSENTIRIGDEVSNSNSIGISFAIGYIVSLYFLLNEKMPPYKKIFYIVIAIICFTFGLLSASRKVLVLLLVSSFAILYLKNSSKNIIRSLFGIILASIVVFSLYNLISSQPMFATANDRFTALIDGIQGESNLDHSSKTRFYMIETGLNVFKKSPILGEGLYASYNYFQTYSHNNFVEILMNTGIIGFLVFYSPYILGIKTFFAINKSERLYSIMLILFLWVLIGGYGMVTYYSKDSMTLMAIVSSWLSMKRSKKYAENI